jgi:hypothetical protein
MDIQQYKIRFMEPIKRYRLLALPGSQRFHPRTL